MAQVARRPVRSETATFVVVGQAAFLAMMASCIAVRPSWLALKRGLSFYGNDPDTVVLFALGIATSVVLTAVGVALLRPDSVPARRFRRGAAAIAALTALVPLTPYEVDPIVDYLHIGITSVLFTAALLFGLWIACALLRDRLALAAAGALLGGGLLVFTAQVGLDDLMIPAQLVFATAFGTLVALGAARLGGELSLTERLRGAAPVHDRASAGRSG
jgi:hypothetical protein